MKNIWHQSFGAKWESLYQRRSPSHIPWRGDHLPALTVSWLARANPTRVLDVGCGLGERTLKLAGPGRTVVGVDVSPTAVAHAKRLAASQGVEGVEFVVGAFPGDGSDERLSGPFDLVVDVGCFHHQEPDQIDGYLAGLHQRLAPDGRWHMYGFAKPSTGRLGAALALPVIRAGFLRDPNELRQDVGPYFDVVGTERLWLRGQLSPTNHIRVPFMFPFLACEARPR